MSRKKIIIIILIAVAFFGYWYFFVMNNGSNNTGGLGNSLKSLFPYGASNNTITGNNIVTTPNNSGENGSSTASEIYDPLVQLSKRSSIGLIVASQNPSALYTPYVFNSTSTDILPNLMIDTTTPAYKSSIFSLTKLPVVRFAERGTGYIYDVDARAQNETKQTGTTIVRAYQAYFGNGGNSVVFRYLKNDNSTIETFLGKIIPPADANSGQFATVKGDFLAENISDLAMAPDGQSFTFILPTTQGVNGINEKISGADNKQIFSSSYDEWLLDNKQNGLTVTTKAANGIPGYAYLVQSTGALQKIIGNLKGLTTNLSPDGNNLLYNTADKDNLNLFLRHSNGDTVKLDIFTLPEKCVWSKKAISAYCAVPTFRDNNANYPDDWYMGLYHFHDEIWKVNAILGTTVRISSLDNKSLDVVDMTMDPSEKYIIFRNKTDGTPWSLDIKPNSSLSNSPAVTSFPSPDGGNQQ